MLALPGLIDTHVHSDQAVLRSIADETTWQPFLFNYIFPILRHRTMHDALIEFLEHGIKVGLGADGAPCNNNLDMFTEMRLAGLIHKPRCGPRSMNAHQVLEMATIGGARVLNLDHAIGSLEVGKRADVIVLKREGLHAQPQHGVDPVAQVVYESKAADVDTVLIDGAVVVRNGSLTRMDHAEIRARANESARRVLSRAAV